MSSLHFQINRADFRKQTQRRMLLAIVSTVILALLLVLIFSDFPQSYSVSLTGFTGGYLWFYLTKLWAWGKQWRQQSESEITINNRDIWQTSPKIENKAYFSHIRSMLIKKKGDEIESITLRKNRSEALHISQYDDMPHLAASLHAKLTDSVYILETTGLKHFLIYEGGAIMLFFPITLLLGRFLVGVPLNDLVTSAWVIPFSLSGFLGHFSSARSLVVGPSTKSQWRWERAIEICFSVVIIALGIYGAYPAKHLFTSQHPCSLNQRSQTSCTDFFANVDDRVAFSNTDNSFLWMEFSGISKREFGRIFRSKLTTIASDDDLGGHYHHFSQSFDGSNLLFTRSEKAMIWDLQAEAPSWSHESDYSRTAILSYDNQTILIQESHADDETNTPSKWQLWDIKSNSITNILTDTYRAAFSPTQPRLAYTNLENRLFIYDIETDSNELQIDIGKTKNQNIALSWSDDGSLIAVRTWQKIIVYASDTLEEQNRFEWPSHRGSAEPISVTFSPNNSLLVTNLDSRLILSADTHKSDGTTYSYIRGWSLETNEIAFTQRVDTRTPWVGIKAIDVTNGGELLAVSVERDTFLFDIEKMTSIYQAAPASISSR